MNNVRAKRKVCAFDAQWLRVWQVACRIAPRATLDVSSVADFPRRWHRDCQWFMTQEVCA